VDAGVKGILRRLGIEGAVDSIGRLFHFRSAPPSFISWNDVESLPTHNAGEPLKLKVSHEKLSKLHPADIGEILNQLDPAHRKEVLETLDIETAAEALAEADDSVQVTALQHLDKELAADILETMPADEAADVLGDMDHAHRQELLGSMDADEREDVEELLEYNDKTAGGLMTNEYVAINQGLTAQQTIDKLRELEPEAETIYYVYVIDADERLVGVISLRDLLIAQANTLVSDFMIPKVRRVSVDATVEEVAHTFERYKLLALPVVDKDDCLQGIITIDDTLEQLLPEDWRRRPYPKSRAKEEVEK
jgi:Mg2+ transporter MgtE